MDNKGNTTNSVSKKFSTTFRDSNRNSRGNTTTITITKYIGNYYYFELGLYYNIYGG